MSTQIQRRRGTTAEHSTFTGALAETTVDTTKDTVVVHDGVTVGGHPLLREDGSNSALALGSAATPALKFTGDTNTGLYSPGADQVAISTNGSGRLFINANGEIGANTTSFTAYGLRLGPTSGQTISLLGLTAGSTSANSRIDFGDSASNDIGRITYEHSVDAMLFNTNGTERLRITSDGKVGIGTSAPQSILDAYTSGGRFQIYPAVNVTGTRILSVNTAGSAAAPLEISSSQTLFTNASNAVVAAIDGPNARVGIGTSAPQSQLQVLNQIKVSNSAQSEGSVVLGDGASTAFNVGIARWNGGANAPGAGGIGYFSQGTVNVGGHYFYTGDTVAGSQALRLVIDSSGRVGIGMSAPGNQSASASQLVVGNTSSNNGITILTGTANDGVLNFNDGENTSLRGYLIYEHSSDALRFGSAGTERARIDSSGRLLVGTSSARGGWYNTTGTSVSPVIQTDGTSFTTSSIALAHNENAAGEAARILLGKSRGTTAGSFTVVQNGDDLGAISFQGADGTNFVEGAHIKAFVDGAPGADDMPGRLVFSTTADGASIPTERMRIDSAGQINTFSGNPSNTLNIANANAASTSINLITGNHSATATGTGTLVFIVRTNGNVLNTNNSYGAISDIKLKENIVDATSQWDDIKALQVRKYNFKEGQTHTQIGLVAQEVELVSPGLVTESPDRDAEGNDLGTVTKSVNYSVLYMKAVKALQEAMERIETLEAKVAALEGA